jgi:hypothetical protein
MNDNIKRIAERTNFTIADSPLWKLKVEEFSQELVKECARFMDEYADREGSDLLEHFEIKK